MCVVQGLHRPVMERLPVMYAQVANIDRLVKVKNLIDRLDTFVATQLTVYCLTLMSVLKGMSETPLQQTLMLHQEWGQLENLKHVLKAYGVVLVFQQLLISLEICSLLKYAEMVQYVGKPSMELQVIPFQGELTHRVILNVQPQAIVKKVFVKHDLLDTNVQ